MNTTDFLSIATAICPDRDFIIFEGKRLTFEQINERANSLAESLRKMGINKGDRIGMLDVNCSEYIEAYFGSAKLGAIFVPLNFRAKPDELGYLVSNAGLKAMFVGARYLDLIERILLELSAVQQCIIIGAEGGQGKISYEELVRTPVPESAIADIEDEDVTILMYTAGTTGRPKGVPLRHSGFVSYVLQNVEPASPEIQERNLLTVPMYHVAGMQAMLCGVYGGRTLVMMRQFEVNEWLDTVEREQVTRAMLVPTMLKWIVEDAGFKKHDLKSLQVITYGAAPMPFEIITKAIREMPWVRFINAFGQTETASTITILGPEDHILGGSDEEIQKKLKRLAGSIGRPLPDVEIRVVDEEGISLPPLETGEILARGQRVMTGYWRDDEKTAQVMTEDGWLRTGDKGWIDEDGYVYLAGRGDDMIIRGGENVSPEEVENVLHTHPKIEEVAVIGVPDPEWGQEPRAIVVLKKDLQATEEEIIEYCRAHLAGFKRPRSVVFAQVLPRNTMGKVLRKELRETYGRPQLPTRNSDGRC